MPRPKLPPDQKRTAKAFYITPAEAEYLRQCLENRRAMGRSVRLVTPEQASALQGPERPFTPMLKDKWVKGK